MQSENSLTDADFIALRDLIHKKTGIFYTDRNRYLLEARAREFLRQNGPEVSSCIGSLLNPATGPAEWNRLISKITITETSFFRDPLQIAVLAKNVIPEIVKRREQSGSRLLRLWSAGCSSGEEAYTLAILLAEHLKDQLTGWNITIFATDINEEALEACRRAVYKTYALRNTAQELKGRYFRTTSDEKLIIRDELKRLVHPERANLTDAAACKKYAGVDLILLRNVLIYFTATTKSAVLCTCYNNLRDHGYLFLGQSETVSGKEHPYKRIAFANTFAYQKAPER